MITILRKPGWELNPKDKIVNSILKRCEANSGECPCHNPGETSEDRMCPCKEYRENDHCCCGLYVKIKESTPVVNPLVKPVIVKQYERECVFS